MSVSTLLVPCNGCTLCCQRDAVRLLPGDDWRQYKTEPHPYFKGQRMLKHKPNDDCIYLTDKGCGIHPRRPQMCREMDCRVLFKTIPVLKAASIGILPVWKRGQALSLVEVP